MNRGAWLIKVPACALLTACAGSTLPEPDGDPYVRGPVETISRDAAATRLLVRPGPGSSDPCGLWATVDGRTRLLQRRDGTTQRLAMADLGVGDTVEVFVDGAVAESCPAQGHAGFLVRVGG